MERRGERERREKMGFDVDAALVFNDYLTSFDHFSNHNHVKVPLPSSFCVRDIMVGVDPINPQESSV